MKIGIDISQLAYPNTGVANYLQNLLNAMLENDRENEYVLFYSSMRRKIQNSKLKIQNYNSKIIIKSYRYPPSLLNFLWNKLHIFPIENLIGDIDIFITSDWTEPPVKKATKATILYDLIVYKSPQETASRIVGTQKKKLSWVKKESDIIFCISESTKKDAQEILGIDSKKLKVIYPGL